MQKVLLATGWFCAPEAWSFEFGCLYWPSGSIFWKSELKQYLNLNIELKVHTPLTVGGIYHYSKRTTWGHVIPTLLFIFIKMIKCLLIIDRCANV